MNKNMSIFFTTLAISVLIIASVYELDHKRIETNGIIEEENKETISVLSNEVNSGDGMEETEKSKNSGEDSGDGSGEEVVTSLREEHPESEKYSNENAGKLKSNATYMIKVNNLKNTVTIYEKDESGEYTVPYKAMVCSTGIATPRAGSAHKTTTFKSKWLALEGNVYGQYATQITGNILFHSVPYTAKKNDSLEYWEYDKLGTDASLGCIRLVVEDAKWIYDNISSGTIVEFYEDENPGPLGKPEAQIISENEEWRNWDPTDSHESNPWKGGSGIIKNEITVSKPVSESKPTIIVPPEETTEVIIPVIEENQSGEIIPSGEQIVEIETQENLEQSTIDSGNIENDIEAVDMDEEEENDLLEKEIENVVSEEPEWIRRRQ